MRRGVIAAALLACGWQAASVCLPQAPEAREQEVVTLLRRCGAAVETGGPEGPATSVEFHGYEVLAYAAWTIHGLTGTPPAFGVGQFSDDDALAPLPALTRLRRLDLSHSRVTDAGLVHIKGLFKLQKLYLYNTKVADAGLANLKDLDRLEVLDLSKTQVTNAGLAYLVGLERLRQLDLSDSRVDAAGLEALKKLTALQHLDLRGLKPADEKEAAIFEDKVLELQKAIPGLAVVR